MIYKLTKVYLVFGVFLFSLIVSRCSTHMHKYTYLYDEYVHYQVCECGQVVNEELHEFTWIIDKEATSDEDGFKHEKCNICKFEKNFNTVISKTKANRTLITDKKLIDYLCSYNFWYEFFVPDNTLSYNFLWDGYDLQNKFGPKIPKEERVYTYLTEYYEKDNSYYLIYINYNNINKYKDYLREYEKIAINNPKNYHFTSYDNERVIDGKYLFAHQLNKDTNNMIIYNVNNIADICFKIDDFQLCFVAQSKKALIKENISTDTIINKDIIIFNRLEISFDECFENPRLYNFTNDEAYNQKYINNLFNYNGEILETFPLSYEDIDFTSYPYQGMTGYINAEPVRGKIIYQNNEKCVLLPRYILDSNGNIDLLNEESDLFYYEDVFRGYKENFKKAHIDVTKIEDGFYIWSLFRYDDVIEIMKIKKGEEI